MKRFSRNRLSNLLKWEVKLCLIYSLFIGFFIYEFSDRQLYFEAVRNMTKQRFFSNENNPIKLHAKSSISINCAKWNAFTTCNKLWHGDALFRDRLPKDIQVSLVINYCNEDFNLFRKYTHDINTIVKKIIILNRCPRSEGVELPKNALVVEMEDEQDSPDLSIAKWLSKYVSTESNSSHENHFVLFLNSRSIQYPDQYRPIRDVLHATMQYGFGCVLEPPHSTHSIYHDSNVLRTFQSVNMEGKSNYSNLGVWLDHMKISLNDLAPVCYSNSFSIKASDISSKHDVILSLIKTLKHSRGEISEFAERTWAAIFSYPLDLNHVASLRNHAHKILPETCCLTGSLVSEMKMNQVMPLWKGETWIDKVDCSHLSISLAISFCDEDMSWLNKFVAGTSIHNITILSKCNSSVIGFPHNATVVELPNVGQCDHTYTYYMTKMIETNAVENHTIVFLNAETYRRTSTRTLKEMMPIVENNGFACGKKHNGIDSVYHDTAELRQYSRKNTSKFGEWLDQLSIRLPTTITPVCYSDYFATKASTIHELRNTWEKLEERLTEGCHLDESAFVRRTWAGLLTKHLNSRQFNVLKSITTRTTRKGSLSSVDIF